MPASPAITCHLFQGSASVLKAGDHAYSARKVVVDGATGKVSGLVNWRNSAQILDQPTSASQCSIAAEALLGGQPCLAVPATGVDYLSNLAASDFAWLSDGSAATEIFVGAGIAGGSPNRWAYTTQQSSSSVSGTSLFRSGTLSTIARVGTGTTWTDASVSTTMVGACAAYVTKRAASPVLSLGLKGLLQETAAYSEAPTAPPASALRLFRRTPNAESWYGSFAILLLFRRELSSPEKAYWRQYLAWTYRQSF